MTTPPPTPAMSKTHTAGEWHLCQSLRKNSLGTYTVFHGYGETIANQICETAKFLDATLITAAPALIGIAGKIMEAVEEATADYSHPSWNPDAHVEITLTISEVREIAAAIAKAKGEYQ